MPEGDTIFRAATSLRRWLEGREVTAARGAGLERVVGGTVDAVEARGKHLLLRFSTGHVLHTHMRMTGSWHVYPAGGPWRKPARQARAVLTCGDRVAVCFNAPVVELLSGREERDHRGLVRLGPDVLDPSFDLEEVVRRSAAKPEQLLGEVLLDQQVVAGLGNIYRCESLFLQGLDPWAPRSSLDDDGLRSLVATGRRLIAANAAPGSPTSRSFGAGPDQPWVYGRAGRACRRCGATVRAAKLGAQARTCSWCPGCQGPGPG